MSRPQTPSVDVLVVGGGIVGLATAHALVGIRPGLTVTVLEKEEAVGTHQSGRNSGVIHSGLYYSPGSAKARMVADGRARLSEFATEHGLAIERRGKVVVATSTREVEALRALRRRGAANGVETELLGRRGLQELEPHIEGMAALHVPATAVIDFGDVCRALADSNRAAGVAVEVGCEVLAIDERAGRVDVGTTRGPLTARVLVGCAGLHSDHLALLAGAPLAGMRIIPFRGEYHSLRPERAFLIRGLVYPVPDPRFPFLGVHLTRGIDGSVHVGPNAVVALSREGYSWDAVDRDELVQLLRAPQSLRLALRHWRTGTTEIVRSLSRSSLVRAVRRMVPELEPRDLAPAPAGVRAQAVAADGSLVDDFTFVETDRTVHAVNAPSPAATASLEIGRVVATRALELLR